ncbi:MAG: RluA family pseudouridine synthase [Lachnospiraceae bacterium]|nr:RluA family pseudouridine synthase [Candidatus Equihabitans merdae]
MKELIISKADAGQRLDKYLAKYLNEAPKSFIYKMLRKKNITLNGKKAEGSQIIKESDCLRLFLSDDTISGFRKEAAKKVYTGIRPDILFEDDDILILNKPCGMLTQSDKSGDSSVADFLLDYLSDSKTEGYRPSPCHRLDRNTSGILICGKTISGHQKMSALIKERDVAKHYLALVHGKIKDESLEVAFGHKDPAENKLTVSAKPKDGYAVLKTSYKKVETNHDLSLAKVKLITGRSHQIRAHMAFLGHPLVGDMKYGSRSDFPENDRSFRIKYQLLHAYSLTFPNAENVPEILRGRCIKAPLPSEYCEILRRLGFEKYNNL